MQKHKSRSRIPRKRERNWAAKTPQKNGTLQPAILLQRVHAEVSSRVREKKATKSPEVNPQEKRTKGKRKLRARLLDRTSSGIKRKKEKKQENRRKMYYNKLGKISPH